MIQHNAFLLITSDNGLVTYHLAIADQFITFLQYDPMKVEYHYVVAITIKILNSLASIGFVIQPHNTGYLLTYNKDMEPKYKQWVIEWTKNVKESLLVGENNE